MKKFFSLVILVMLMFCFPALAQDAPLVVAEESLDLMELTQKWMPVILAIIGAFSAAATVTGNTSANRVINMVLKLINFMGMNFGNAENK